MRAILRGAIALALAFAAGVALSFGQTYSPYVLSPLFNSAAPVVAVAGLAAFSARRWWTSALVGALACPALMAGYYITSHVRGYASSASWIALWTTAGLLFGAAMGLAVWCLLSRTPLPVKAASAALWPGIAIGEAWFGLTVNAESTPPAYWWAQVAVGLVVLVAVGCKHLPTWAGWVLAVVFAGVVAVVVHAAYATL